MKIKSIKIENNKVIGNLFLDFTDKEGEVLDTIIIAGDNGSGKSTILDIIYEFSILNIAVEQSPEKREFIVQLSDNELHEIRSNQNWLRTILNNELTVTIDYSLPSLPKFRCSFLDIDSNMKIVHGAEFRNPHSRILLRVIQLDVAINFRPSAIKSVTSLNIDQNIDGSIKSSDNSANEITQLLIDIDTMDALDYKEWSEANIDKLRNGINVRGRNKSKN